MNEKSRALDLLEQVRSGALSPEEALKRLQATPFEDLGFARVDLHRGLRQGAAEVIYGERKTPEQMLGILAAMRGHGLCNILITRLAPEAADYLAEHVEIEYHALPRIGICARRVAERPVGSVVVASGGTSDMPVAEEAALTAEVLGNRVTRLYDAGVAGLHRLLAGMEDLAGARAVVAVAGMEGALASVVGGLVSCPVIAVPTSVGYGASFGGVAALLSMLNSCASGVSVVNIDNGFGAGFLASRINQMEGLPDAQ
jgi:NCAIR mutase (PurE)-related proteins